MKISFNICPNCSVGVKNLNISKGIVFCSNCKWFGTINLLKKITLGGQNNG